MNVFIPLETASREDLYKVYLSSRLSEVGCNVYLGSKANIYKLVQSKRNFVYLDKGYHQGVSDDLYRRIKLQGGRIANLDEEGAVDFANNQTLINRYSGSLEQCADVVFFWGEMQRELAAFDDVNGPEQIVTGHPRFELLQPNFEFLYANEARSIRQKYGSYFLINTNMGFGNNIKGPDFVIENYQSRFPNIKELIEFDNLKATTVIELAKHIAASSGNTIVLRPHPEEDCDFYEKSLAGLENINVVRKGSVVPWLFGAHTVIHPDCTTAIETKMMGKIPISLLPPNSNTELITRLPVSVSVRYNDARQLADDISAGVIATKSGEIVDDELSKFFYNEGSSVDKIVGWFAKIYPEVGPSEKFSLLDPIIVKCRLKETLLRLRSDMQQGFVAKKLDGFDFTNIERIMADFRNMDMCRGTKVQKYSDKLFCFSKL